MGRYYVAGIPFDSENSLKHYGVKNMEWGKHKFGIDADDRYIKWLKNAGQNIGKFATNTAQNIAKGATAAARTAGTAVNKGANFVTGNQYRQNADAKRNEARDYNQKAANPVRSMGYAGDTKTARPSQWFDKDAGLSGRDYSQQIADQQRVYASKAAKANQQANEYERRANNAVIPNANRVANLASKAVGQQTRNVGSAIGTATGRAGSAVSTAAQNVGNAARGAAQNVGNFFSNQDEYQRLDDLSKHYNRNTGKWDSEENRKAFYDAQNAYNSHPLTAIPDMARQIGSNISNSPVGDFARDVGEMANQVGSNVKNFVDYNVTGEGQRRIANMLMQNPDEVNKIFENDGSGWKQSDQFTNREAAERALAEANNTPFGRVSNAAQNVGNAVSGAANKAAEGAKGFLNSAGQWVSGAANNVKSTASKAASDASNGANGFLNSAGQWVSNAAGNVRKAAENVGNNVGQAAEQARGGIGGFFDRVGDAARSAAQNVGGAVQNAGDWVGDRARDVGSAVSGTAQNVGNNVSQAAEQARGGIGGFFDRVGDTVRGAADSVGDWGRQTAQNVGGAVQTAGNWIGDHAREAAGNVSGLAQNAGQAVDQARGSVGGFFDRVGDWGREAAGNVGGWIGDRANDVGRAISGAAGNTRDWAGQAAQNAGGFFDRVGDWGREASGNVGGAISGAAGNVRDLAGQTAGNVRDWAGQTAGNVGNAVSGAADWARNVANRNNFPMGGTLTEQYIPEQRISEQTTRDLDPGQQKEIDSRVRAIQDRIDNFDDYYNILISRPGYHNYTRQDVMDGLLEQKDYWQNHAFREDMQHSAIDEKPEGVSDAFWEKFTAEGGTREDYERDWR